MQMSTDIEYTNRFKNSLHKVKEEVWLSIPSFMRLICSNNQPFQCVPLAWQRTGLSGPGIYSAHYSIFYGHCRVCVPASGQREAMIWLLVMTAPSVRLTGLLAHRRDKTMLEHGSVWLCRSALTEMAFSTAEEHRIPILLNFKRWKLLKLNRNVQPHKYITHQGWIHLWAFLFVCKISKFWFF